MWPFRRKRQYDLGAWGNLPIDSAVALLVAREQKRLDDDYIYRDMVRTQSVILEQLREQGKRATRIIDALGRLDTLVEKLHTRVDATVNNQHTRISNLEALKYPVVNADEQLREMARRDATITAAGVPMRSFSCGDTVAGDRCPVHASAYPLLPYCERFPGDGCKEGCQCWHHTSDADLARESSRPIPTTEAYQRHYGIADDPQQGWLPSDYRSLPNISGLTRGAYKERITDDEPEPEPGDEPDDDDEEALGGEFADCHCEWCLDHSLSLDT